MIKIRPFDARFTPTRTIVVLMLVVLLLAATSARASTTLQDTHSWTDDPFDFYTQTKLVDEGGGDYYVFTKIDMWSDVSNFYIVKARLWSQEFCNGSFETDTKVTSVHYNVDPSPNWGVQGQSDDGYGTGLSCFFFQAIMFENRRASFENVELYDINYSIDYKQSRFLCMNIRAGGLC